MSTIPVIVWFRQNLRLSDTPALQAACNRGCPIIPLYILDDDTAKEWKMGRTLRVWLHHAFGSLSQMEKFTGKIRWLPLL